MHAYQYNCHKINKLERQINNHNYIRLRKGDWSAYVDALLARNPFPKLCGSKWTNPFREEDRITKGSGAVY